MLGRVRREGFVLMAKVIPLYKTNDAAWVNIEDLATPYLRYLQATFPREMKSAMKSLGWFLRGKIVEGLQTSSPGGRRLAPLSLIQRVRLLDAVKTIKRRKKRADWARGTGARGRYSHFAYYTPARVPGGATEKPYGRKMAKAVRYFYDDPAKSVHIGWITPTASSFGRALAAGRRGAKHQWENKGSQTVTARMSKLFAAAGIFVKPGKQLKTPARPVVDPIFQKYKGEIPRYLEDKVSKWLARSLSRSLTYTAGRAIMGNTPAFRYMARNAA